MYILPWSLLRPQGGQGTNGKSPYGFNERCSWADFGFRRCPSSEISKFHFSWATGEPKTTLKSPDRAPGQLRFSDQLKNDCQN